MGCLCHGKSITHINMSISGIQVDPEVVECYQQLKTGRSLPWFSMKISDDKAWIVVDHKGEAGGDSESNHAALDVQAHSKTAGRDVQKIFFVVWAPDTAPIKEKMTASTKDAVKTALEGVNFERQCTDRDEYAYEGFIAVCDSTAR